MTGWMFASYVVAWVLLLLVCVTLVGVLRQIGILRLRVERALPTVVGSDLPPLSEDGPAIGSPMIDLVSESMNGRGPVDLIGMKGNPILLMFMSPMCETCQHVVEPLNSLVSSGSRVQPVVIMRADEHACRSFDSVFPLDAPIICDAQRDITPKFDIHRNPFGLLYDDRGRLMRKGEILAGDLLDALLGDAREAENLRDHIFPWPDTAATAEGAGPRIVAATR